MKLARKVKNLLLTRDNLVEKNETGADCKCKKMCTNMFSLEEKKKLS